MMDKNPGFENSEDNGDIWASWDDGAVEVPELENVILRVPTKCPHCDGDIALNYTARGIVFDHDDVLAQLEAENAALKRENEGLRIDLSKPPKERLYCAGCDLLTAEEQEDA